MFFSSSPEDSGDSGNGSDTDTDGGESSEGNSDNPSYGNSVLGWLRGIAEGIGNLAGNIKEGIIDGIKNLFVPDDGYFESKFKVLTDKFAFWRSVTDTIDVFKNFFKNTDFNEPPTITVNLSSAQGKYDYGQNAIAIDLSWYEPYREVVDLFLSSIFWVIFVWNTWNDLPNLLNGISTVVGMNNKGGTDT